MTERVSFLICGTQKGGTTALDAYLRSHPQLQLASTKEVHFFDNDDLFKSNNPDYDWYHSHFDASAGGRLRGESTPIYMYWKAAPLRIYRYNPTMKIILLLRNPIDRAYSHWNMEYQRGNDDRSFRDALAQEESRCRGSDRGQHRIFSYVDRGFYSQQIARLSAFFPGSNIGVFRSESLLYHPEQTLASICLFLGVDPFDTASFLRAHALPYPQSMQAQERSYLRSVFRDEIRLLEKMFRWDCSAWLEG
jgi:hypothetical protein